MVILESSEFVCWVDIYFCIYQKFPLYFQTHRIASRVHSVANYLHWIYNSLCLCLKKKKEKKAYCSYGNGIYVFLWNKNTSWKKQKTKQELKHFMFECYLYTKKLLIIISRCISLAFSFVAPSAAPQGRYVVSVCSQNALWFKYNFCSLNN